MTTGVIAEAGPQEFSGVWADSNMYGDGSVVLSEAFVAADHIGLFPEDSVSTLSITDVTLRDGQQQRTLEVTTEQRVEVFDSIVATGVDRIEIGHLGNGNGDQQLASAIIEHIAQAEAAEDQHYDSVKLQVLFGSQEDKIQEGIGVLQAAFQEHYGENWQDAMNDRVVVHVYDRLAESLRSTASTPYSEQESAERICSAAQHALNAGFTSFSVSGEGATAETPESAIQFHRAINTYLFDHGAQNVNVNLANTFGISANDMWNTDSLAVFNAAVKHGYQGQVSTSIHTHNDYNSAVDFSLMAVVAGFDRVEGAHTGMGERAGNVASVDVVARVLEQANNAVAGEYSGREQRSLIAARRAGSMSLRRMVQLDKRIADNLGSWYQTGETISDVFGPDAEYRWHRTALGNPYAFDNGSGPHDQVMAVGIEDPQHHPVNASYERFLPIANIMGRPMTEALAVGDLEAAQAVTVANHAGGGRTSLIRDGKVKRASPEVVEAARSRFKRLTGAITHKAIKGVMIELA